MCFVISLLSFPCIFINQFPTCCPPFSSNVEGLYASQMYSEFYKNVVKFEDDTYFSLVSGYEGAKHLNNFLDF